MKFQQLFVLVLRPSCKYRSV